MSYCTNSVVVPHLEFLINSREFVEALEQELTERDSQVVIRRMVSEAKQIVSSLILLSGGYNIIVHR